ncbi:hypothetical protein [Diplocloster hominis]|uniref:hypothetical protein n=1 Tax=Diplocloster hominis TaxID=3079010 RepID=UPI0031BA9527
MDKEVTSYCRYLGLDRRITIPAEILKQTKINTDCIVEFEAKKGCILIKQVIGIAIENPEPGGSPIRKGKWW